MAPIKVAVNGYGVIGKRVADHETLGIRAELIAPVAAAHAQGAVPA